MSKHAPEPWFVVRHNSPMKWTIQTREDGGGECIAQQYGDSPLKYARLIAASPELLAALKELTDKGSWSRGDPQTKRALAVIAKAEGVAPENAEVSPEPLPPAGSAAPQDDSFSGEDRERI